MEIQNRLGLGTGGFAGNPAKIFLVYSGIADDVRELAVRFGIDEVEGSPLIFSSIEEAINAGLASRGDTIMVAPGHVETLSDATTLNLDKAGIFIIGLGSGDNRPVITLDTAVTATIPVTAANIEIHNVIFTANFADIVAFFTLTTANNFALRRCAFRATAADLNAQHVVDTNAVSNDADGLTIEDCEWIEPDLTTESMVKMDGDNARVSIKRNYVSLGVNNNTPALMAIAAGKSVFNAEVEDNKVYRLNTDTATGAILITTNQSDNSGVIGGNQVQHADVAAELLVTASSGFGFFENYASGVAGASGYLLPAADS